MPAFRRIAFLLPLAALFALACDGDNPIDPDPDPDPVPTAIEVGLWNFQHGIVGTTLAQPVVFAVYDNRDQGSIPVPGVTVNVDVVSGGGTVSGGPFVTDDEGLVSVTWTLGTTAGAQLIRASIPGDTSLATATAHPGSAAAIQKIAGEAQQGTAGSTLADSLVVRVVDAFGNSIENVQVVWSAPSGGSLSPTSSMTDETGLSFAAWQLGTSAGAQGATATHGSLSASFSATATAGSAATIEKVSGDGQSAQPGQELAASLVVRIRDALGNPISGQNVMWSTAHGGTLVPTTSMTDANGLAATRWQLGPGGGAQSATAMAGSLSATFGASAVPSGGTVAALQIASGNNQTDTVANQLPEPISVRAVDAAGNPVAGVSVAFVVTSGGGSVFVGSTTTSAQGLAFEHWTIGTSTSTLQRVEARATDGTNGAPLTATFSATAVADAPSRVKFLSVQPSGEVGEPLPPVVAEANDRFGNPVGGATIVWTALTGSVDRASSVSFDDGTAAAVWTLSTSPGTNSLRAAVGTHSDTAYSVGVVGAPTRLEIAGGNNQTGGRSGTLPEQLVVRVFDQYDNPVTGVALDWIVPEGSVFNRSVSDATGYARAQWQLGPTPGTQQVTATIGADSVTFTATAL